ncbi:MAG: F0F1 ATP synthase subunit B [Phycisphaerae bacterium]|nr:F0F1 ATP synthase subunit B [Phycisphaerae bacterium]
MMVRTFTTAMLTLALAGWISTASVRAADPPAAGHAAPAAAGHAAPAAGHADTSHAAASHATDGHGDGHAESPNIFSGGIGNAIWTTIIFGIVVWVLGTYAWPPLLSMLNERERTIRDSLETAKRERDEARQLLEDYKKQLNNAREQATAIVEEGRRDAEAVKQRIQNETRQEADAMLARAKQEIQLATDGAIKQLYDETTGLAMQAASTVVGKSLTGDDHRELARRALDEMRNARRAQLN